MDKLREWSFPVLFLVAWMAVAAYTISELGVAQAAAVRAARPPAVAPRSEPAKPAMVSELSIAQ